MYAIIIVLLLKSSNAAAAHLLFNLKMKMLHMCAESLNGKIGV